MWFFRQAQQIQPTPQREVEAEPRQRVEPVRQVEPVMPEAPRNDVPPAEWFRDVVQPLEVETRAGANEDFMELIDKNGWWKDETMLT